MFCEPSLEPLSPITISPVTPDRFKKLEASLTQLAIVSASFKQGNTIDSSIS
jgi:hypothetical protein